jgi:hypothetical protein
MICCLDFVMIGSLTLSSAHVSVSEPFGLLMDFHEARSESRAPSTFVLILIYCHYQEVTSCVWLINHDTMRPDIRVLDLGSSWR